MYKRYKQTPPVNPVAVQEAADLNREYERIRAIEEKAKAMVQKHDTPMNRAEADLYRRKLIPFNSNIRFVDETKRKDLLVMLEEGYEKVQIVEPGLFEFEVGGYKRLTDACISGVRRLEIDDFVEKKCEESGRELLEILVFHEIREIYVYEGENPKVDLVLVRFRVWSNLE